MFLPNLFGVLMFHTEPHSHNISLYMGDSQDGLSCIVLLSCVKDKRQSGQA